MKLFLSILVIFVLTMQADETFLSEKELKTIKTELPIEDYKKEYAIYYANINSINNIYKYTKLIFSDKNARFIMMDNLSLLQRQTNSIFVAAIIVDQYLKYMNIADETLFSKYMKRPATLLYQKKMCDGYIFIGEYNERYEHDKEKAMSVYAQGQKECKVPWKNFSLLSRYRKIKYQLRKE